MHLEILIPEVGVQRWSQQSIADRNSTHTQGKKKVDEKNAGEINTEIQLYGQLNFTCATRKQTKHI